jgi:hypothetical protein
VIQSKCEHIEWIAIEYLLKQSDGCTAAVIGPAIEREQL